LLDSLLQEVILMQKNDEIYGRLQVTDAEGHPVRIWIGPRKSSFFCRTAK